jgi:hypothetical protein
MLRPKLWLIFNEAVSAAQSTARTHKLDGGVELTPQCPLFRQVAAKSPSEGQQRIKPGCSEAAAVCPLFQQMETCAGTADVSHSCQ